MKPSRHVIASAALGAFLWHWTKSVPAGLLCFISGSIADLDHVIEYGIHFGWNKVSLKNIYLASEHNKIGEGEHKFKALYVFFHIAEFAIFLWILAVYTENIYVLAVAIGYSSHILLDTFGNSTYFFTYFLTNRIWRKFNINELVDYKRHGKS